MHKNEGCFEFIQLILLQNSGVPIFLRGVVYMLFTFVWEFSTGAALLQVA